MKTTVTKQSGKIKKNFKSIIEEELQPSAASKGKFPKLTQEGLCKN